MALRGGKIPRADRFSAQKTVAPFFEGHFIDFGCFFESVDPHSVWPGPHGSHFSVFAKITEKVASGDQFWDQKWLKIDAGATQNRPKSKKKYIFDDPFFQRFFECKKKRKNAKKGRHLHS